MAVGVGELGGRSVEQQRAEQHHRQGDLHTDDGEERSHPPSLPAWAAGNTDGAEVSRFSSPRGGSDEVDDDLGELGAAVLLEEVPAALDGGVGLALGAGDLLAGGARSAPLVIGSLSLNAHRNGRSSSASTSHAWRFGSAAGIVGRRRHEQRELPRPFLVGLVGERRVVAGEDVGAEVGRAAAVDDEPGRELLDGPGEAAARRRNASPGSRSPVGRNVLAATTRRSGRGARRRAAARAARPSPGTPA